MLPFSRFAFNFFLFLFIPLQEINAHVDNIRPKMTMSKVKSICVTEIKMVHGRTDFVQERNTSKLRQKSK